MIKKFKKCLNCNIEFIITNTGQNSQKFCRNCRPLIAMMQREVYNQCHKERRAETARIRYKIDHWRETLHFIKQRCNNSKHPTYKFYGAKGIKNFLTLDDLKFLWFRDGADKMVQPSIHRKDNKENYTIENCEFLEWEIHKHLPKLPPILNYCI